MGALAANPQATQWSVAVWQEVVFYDATNPNDPNPDLYLGPVGCLNQNVYPAGGAVVETYINKVPSKLNSPPPPPLEQLPGDPDPTEVDG